MNIRVSHFVYLFCKNKHIKNTSKKCTNSTTNFSKTANIAFCLKSHRCLFFSKLTWIAPSHCPHWIQFAWACYFDSTAIPFILFGCCVFAHITLKFAVLAAAATERKQTTLFTIPRIAHASNWYETNEMNVCFTHM